MMATERREYAKPPIAEALCQFTFSERLAWNIATPGVLFGQIQEEYPQEPQGQEQVQATFQAGEGQLDTNLAINRGDQRFIYKDPTATKLFVVNAQAVSANSLSPYEGWPSLRERFIRGLDSLRSVVSVSTVSMVNIRYINRIVVPGIRGFDTDDYFTWTIRTAQMGKASVENVLIKIQSKLSDGVTTAVSTFATIPTEEAASQFLLDLELSRPVDNISLEEAITVADELKVMENAEFESSITDKTRGLFQ